jgi:hypothetical protein
MIETYRRFVIERHRIWERRQLGLPGPWTTDPVLATRKFCNVFRVLDAGSQFLVGELLPATDFHTALMRCFLYRYTNRPEPWVAFKGRVGHYPSPEDLTDGSLLDFWRVYRAEGGAVFGNAYKMFSGLENRGTDRLTWAVELARTYFADDIFTDTFAMQRAQADRARLLQTIPRCAGFMSMQILTDIGYSEHVQADENEFIIPGPGARAGAAHIAPERDAEDLIRELTYYWAGGPAFLYGRPPSLMDVQNTLCEFSKYVKYKPSTTPYTGSGPLPEPILPTHWRLNP